VTPSKILVTDHSWESLEVERAILHEAGVELVTPRHGSEHELIELAGDVAAIMTNWLQVNRAVLDAAPACLTVARYGVGVDNVDVEHASELGIVVTNVPDFCTDEVAEHALALILALTRHIVPFARQTAGGGWDNVASGPIRRLRSQTLGLVGYGNLARALAQRAQGVGMRVIAYSRSTSPGSESDGVEMCTLDDLLARADVVSIHVPLTEQTRGMIGAAQIAAMKPSAILINTARGAVVDSAALASALAQGQLAGAGLDVLPTEPPDRADPLLAMEQVIVTPHAAAFSVESTIAVQQGAARGVADVLGGRIPANVVNAEVLTSPRLRAARLAGKER
jgi:D-3-phosphoglycerate dehydrogenase